MELELSMRHRVVRKAARGFAQEVLAPWAEWIDREARFPEEILESMKPLGYFGLQIPARWEGAGLDTLASAIVVEELSKACPAVGLMVSVHNSVAVNPIWRFGTPQQRDRYLPCMARGDRIGAFCLTEPNAGSDTAAVQTRAELQGEHFIISGNKIFVTNGGEAGIALVIARTQLTSDQKEWSLLIVETDREGCLRGHQEDLVGMRGNPVCPLVFQECRVPRENLLGEPGRGLRIALEALDGGRVGIAAQALGIAQAALEASIQYAMERIQFERPIGHLQAIQAKVADMAVQVEAARLLTYKAARACDAGNGATQAAAMAKLFASATAVRAALEAVQIFGGYGYTRAYPVERYLRDAKATEIYEGTSEIQRLVISRKLLFGRKKRP